MNNYCVFCGMKLAAGSNYCRYCGKSLPLAKQASLEDLCRLSYYKDIAVLDEEHGVYLVQHVENKHIFVKKQLDIFDGGVFVYLKTHQIHGIPQVCEVVRNENILTVIEEYIPGITLKNYLEQNGLLSEKQSVDIVLQLCDTLRTLHSATPPIIHSACSLIK